MDLSGIWGQLLFNPSSSICVRPSNNINLIQGIQIIDHQPSSYTTSSDTNSSISSDNNSLHQESGDELNQDQEQNECTDNNNETNVEEDNTSEDSKKKSTQRVRYSKEEYRCRQCPYTCTTEKAFLRHLRKCETKETGDEMTTYPLSCPICGKDRRDEESLSLHMTKHRQEKHFCCDICRFRSLQLKKLIQHRRMHTGEKPHLCPFCIYRSSRRDNLRSHVRRVHKRENLPCDTFTPRSMLLSPRKFD